MTALALAAMMLLVAQEKGQIVGVGGVFFKSPDNKRLYTWYEEKLGLPNKKNVGIAIGSGSHTTYLGIFRAEAKYFEGPLMVNYIVDDMDALLAKLEKSGVRIDPKRSNSAEGRFAWIFDPDGNKIELWEPTRSAKPQ